MLNGASGNANTDLAQFALNAFGSSSMVISGHLLEHGNDCGIQFRATGWTFGACFAAPDEMEEVTMPAENSFRLDDEEGLLPVGEVAGEEDRQSSFAPRQPGRYSLPLENEELLAKKGVLTEQL
jgi:hypothetical protein